MVGYFLVGAATGLLGAAALARWVVLKWEGGERFIAVASALCAVVILTLFVFAVRRHLLLPAAGAALVWCGFAAYVLSMYGLSLPPSWLEPLK